jgi:hypothetical protein
MMKISPQFNDSYLFPEPTDAEISEMLDGTPVFSFRPEDLPNYKPSHDHYSILDKSLRGRALAKKIFAFHPSYTDMNLRKISDLASSRSFAAMRMRTKVTSKGSEPDLFILKRPSLKISDVQFTSNFLGIHSASITPHIPEAVSRFVAVHHEIDHMQQILNGSNTSKGDYHSELSAESNGIAEFNRVSQNKPYSNGILKALINRRALAAFTVASSEYWIAPALRKMFLEHDYMFSDDHSLDVYKSYSEIRLRVAILADNQSAVEIVSQLGLSQDEIAHNWEEKDSLALNSSSHYLQEAISLWESNNVTKVYKLKEELPDSNMYLAHFIPQLQKIRQSVGYKTQLNTGETFQYLDRIQKHGNISQFTRQNIAQILDGARIFCPEISPQHPKTENTAKLTCPEPKN